MQNARVASPPKKKKKKKKRRKTKTKKTKGKNKKQHSKNEEKQAVNTTLKVKRSHDTAHVLGQSAEVTIQEAADDGLADVGGGAMADIGRGVEEALQHLLLAAVLQVLVLLELLIGLCDDLHGKGAGYEQVVTNAW